MCHSLKILGAAVLTLSAAGAALACPPAPGCYSGYSYGCYRPSYSCYAPCYGYCYEEPCYDYCYAPRRVVVTRSAGFDFAPPRIGSPSVAPRFSGPQPQVFSSPSVSRPSVPFTPAASFGAPSGFSPGRPALASGGRPSIPLNSNGSSIGSTPGGSSVQPFILNPNEAQKGNPRNSGPRRR